MTTKINNNHAIKKALNIIQEKKIKFVDLRFTDTNGKEQHVTINSNVLTKDFFSEGKIFDGSSISGWKDISESDMVLMPDPITAIVDPFYNEPTLNIRCDILDPTTMNGYERDPRSVAKRAEQYLISTGIADTAFFGPEPEFFLFDDVKWQVDIHSAFYTVDSREAAWNSGTNFEGGNLGHRPKIKGGYFPVPPVDSSQDIRTEICLTLEQIGIIVEAHHHEVATGNQNEVATVYNTLVNKADELQVLKYVIHNVAHRNNKTATFMPKPVVGDNGNGMHCHQSLYKDDINLFIGDAYGGLSELALYYIGGILKHAKAINAFTNSTTNSYKRLIPGFEAPVTLAYSARNRSAAIRIPHVAKPKSTRIEVRFPDAANNPYLSFSCMMMAGLDGIRNKIHPGEPMDRDLYELSAQEPEQIPTVSRSLAEALECLSNDRDFLLAGGVFTSDLIDSFIELKQQEIEKLNSNTHPIEFDMYYSL